MNKRELRYRRRGAVLVLVTVCLIGLMGMVALAIDIGMIAVARTQCQNAADSSAMTGARTVSGNKDTGYNFAALPANALTAAKNNKILNSSVQTNPSKITKVNAYTYVSENVKVEAGAYTYFYNDADPNKEGFKIMIPRPDETEPYSAVRVTVSNANSYSFGRVFGLSTFNTSASAVAVHRPRDVIIIMDLSGSMRFQSLAGIPYSGNRTTSMNPDAAFPKFGHYSDTAGAALQGTVSIPAGTGEFYDPANISVSTNSGPPIIEDFYANAIGVAPAAGNRAFTRASDAYATAPGGDSFLKTSLNTGGTYAKTVREFNNNSSTTNPKFEALGYANYSASFSGYTEGPGYWGKTFWVWPPNPCGQNVVAPPGSLGDTTYSWHDNGSRDWRQRFFVGVNVTNGNTPAWIQHNTILFDSNGTLRLPGTSTTVTENGASVRYTYRINYAAILHWLAQGPNPFPSTIQAGRIRYYNAIPSGTDTALNNRWWTKSLSNLSNDERFWKEYIDFVLGFQETGVNSYKSVSARIGNGDYFSWSGGTIQVSQRPQPQPPSTDPSAPYLTGTTGPHQSGITAPYMTTTTSAKASSGGTSVSVNSLSAFPVANTNYVTFNNDLTRVYLITNSSKTSLKVSPALKTTINSGTSVQVYSTDNTSGEMKVSVSGLSATPVANSDYIGFGGSSTNLYLSKSGGSTSQLSLTTGLAAQVALKNVSVEVYASNGAVGANRLSVTGLAQAPVVNRDYVVFNGDFSNPYLITAVANGAETGRILTVSPTLAASVNVNGASVQVFSPYMDYSDNVRRPRHQFWFGPQTWVDWLGNYNTDKWGWPGNVHEAQNWACKVGIQTAIDDIKNNHPSDFIGLAFFSSPRYSTSGEGQHNNAIVPLGRNYQMLKDSLWFPPTTIIKGVKEITPFDEDFENVPRAHGGTAPGMGFMIAYNLLSPSVDLRLWADPQPDYRGSAGGLGRRGANRLIIFETDGVPNTRAYADFVAAGKNSYYPIRVKQPEKMSSGSNEFPKSGGYSSSEVYDVVEQICRLETDSSPGYSTSRKPVLIYPLGYGSLFDPKNASTNQNNALDFMQNVAYRGNTAKTGSGGDFPDWQRIYGTNEERISRMQAAFTRIMQSGIQVSLIE